MIKTLLVDDDKNLLRMARVRLERHYEVITASGGEDALRMIDGGLAPDIVLLDIDMPGMDGFETFALMRERPALEYVPIIFLTSLADEEEKLRGLGMGATDYLTKPFEGGVITMRIPLYIEAARERRRLHEMEESGVVLIDWEKFPRMAPQLNDLERTVTRLALLGRNNAEIGERLSYSGAYVKKLMSGIYDKLGVNSRDELKKFFGSAES